MVKRCEKNFFDGRSTKSETIFKSFFLLILHITTIYGTIKTDENNTACCAHIE